MSNQNKDKKARKEVIELDVNQLQPNPYQPRDRIKTEDLQEIMASIKSYGVLEPLVVANTPPGYQIIAGERRWRAAREAGLKTVPCITKTTDRKGMVEMALIENVQREDLNPIEKAQAFAKLTRDFGLSTTEIGKRIGKSRSYISNNLRLLKLPDAIKDGLISNEITEGHGRAIASIGDVRAMIECYKLILKEKANVRRAEELARRFKRRLKTGNPRPRRKAIYLEDVKYKKWQQSLNQIFSTPTQVKLSRSNNQTKIIIYLKGDVDETQEDLDSIMKMTGLPERVIKMEDSQTKKIKRMRLGKEEDESDEKSEREQKRKVEVYAHDEFDQYGNKKKTRYDPDKHNQKVFEKSEEDGLADWQKYWIKKMKKK